MLFSEISYISRESLAKFLKALGSTRKSLSVTAGGMLLPLGFKGWKRCITQTPDEIH